MCICLCLCVSAGVYVPGCACQGQRLTLTYELLGLSCLCPPPCHKSTRIIEIRSTMLEFYVSSGIQTQVFMLVWQAHLPPEPCPQPPQ